jgi:hypothetical protein
VFAFGVPTSVDVASVWSAGVPVLPLGLVLLPVLGSLLVLLCVSLVLQLVHRGVTMGLGSTSASSLVLFPAFLLWTSNTALQISPAHCSTSLLPCACCSAGSCLLPMALSLIGLFLLSLVLVCMFLLLVWCTSVW